MRQKTDCMIDQIAALGRGDTSARGLAEAALVVWAVKPQLFAEAAAPCTRTPRSDIALA